MNFLIIVIIIYKGYTNQIKSNEIYFIINKIKLHGIYNLHNLHRVYTYTSFWYKADKSYSKQDLVSSSKFEKYNEKFMLKDPGKYNYVYSPETNCRGGM